MTLRTDTVPALGRQLCRVHDGASADVLFALAVAALASHSAFEKRTRGEAILCGRDRLQPAGVTLQARWLYRTRQVQMIVTLLTRRQVPSRFGGVIRDGRLIQEAVAGEKVAAAHGAGSDEVLECP